MAHTVIVAIGYNADMAGFIFFPVTFYVFTGGPNPFRIWKKQTNKMLELMPLISE